MYNKQDPLNIYEQKLIWKVLQSPNDREETRTSWQQAERRRERTGKNYIDFTQVLKYFKPLKNDRNVRAQRDHTQIDYP